MIRNEKGFAITTMLYGILAMVTLLMFLILNIMGSSRRMNNNFIDTIEKKLNNCVEEEIYLESCYVNGEDCDKSSYYSCLGIYEEEKDNDPNAQKLADVLKKTVVTTGDGLYLDPYENNRYIYRGTFANNYLSYSGMLWRILAIESDGTIKIVLMDYDLKLAWDSLTETSWSATTLNNYLARTFYTSKISDTSKFATRKIWNVGKLEDVATLTLSDAIAAEKKEVYQSENVGVGVLGLVSVSDYAKASIDPNCASNVIQNTACNSWMTKGTFWTITGVQSEGDSSAMLVSEGSIQKYNVNNNVNVYPAAYLKANALLKQGNGEASNPYVLE